MAFPPASIQTNVTDATDQAGLHADLHNRLAAAANDITVEVQRVGGEVVRVEGKVDANRTAQQNGDTTLQNQVNALDQRVSSLEPVVTDLRNDAARVGAKRGRTNIDAVSDGGSVRYTQDFGTYGVVDTGDGSGYTVPTGVYGVSASTIPDGGDDLTCYIDIGGRSVAVGSRLPGDGATYATWVGEVVAGQQIVVRVRMPTPRAVVGGRLEIWRLAEST